MTERVTASDLSFFQNLYTSIASEMGASLTRTAFSPNIKERRDFSCAVFDAQGRLLSQAAHIPVHLGAMPRSVEAALQAFPDLGDGEAILLNDPFAGGTHLPDLTMVSPVMDRSGNQPFLYLATRAHHADVGGISPGSLPVSTHIFEEGIRIPPVRFVRGREMEAGLLAVLCANSRTPDERRGDLRAQLNAHLTGEQRCRELIQRYEIDRLASVHDALLAYGERMMRSCLLSIPDGGYESEEHMDGGAVLRCCLTVFGDAVTADLRQSDPAESGSCNAVRAITESAVIYAFLCLLHDQAGSSLIPINAGCFEPIELLTSSGSIVDASWPSAVAGGNVETSQRIVELLFSALAEALPGQISAQSQGTMNNITLGGIAQDGTPFSYYETIGGGAGASAEGPGMSGHQIHMTNTLNTPVEALEFAYPFRVTRYGLRDGSGGAGTYAGGAGVVRDYAFEVPTHATLLSERRIVPAAGRNGGTAGQCGANTLRNAEGFESLPSNVSCQVVAGDALRIETPGGGGFGPGA